MDFTIPEQLVTLRERFVRDEITPHERDPRQSPQGPSEKFRRELVVPARRAGLSAPHVGREWGDLG
jgi:acyl-CoA dehydrogenase